ncbi:MAG: DegT/DnrJ/EryC1/StrS family aminotransferase, partial [Ilumatobacteraceae bacterium]
HLGEGSTHPAHMFFLLLPDLTARTAFIAHMRARGVLTVFHYVPLHSAVAATRFAEPVVPCPVTDDVSDRLVRLPLFAGITDQEVAKVIEAAVAFRC